MEDRASGASGEEPITAEEHGDVVDKLTKGLETTTDDAMIRVFVDGEGNNQFKILSRGKKMDKTSMNIELIDFLIGLQDEITDRLPDGYLEIYTRHTRGESIWHAHPNYRGMGPWKDWALVDWGSHGILPAHVQCFIDLEKFQTGPRVEYGGVWLKSGTYAVVESSEYEQEDEELRQSEIFLPILKEVGEIEGNQVEKRSFYLADVEAFNDVACVIPDIGGPPNRYFFVHQRPHWAELFEQWVKAPHKEDDISDDEEKTELPPPPPRRKK